MEKKTDVEVTRYFDAQASAEELSQERLPENRLRPKSFDEYPGQERARENLRVYVEAAKRRTEALDHVLLHGPPGLGKTSLAKIVSFELGVPFVQTSGPALDKAGDLAGILAGLEVNSVLFIDEIHRLSIVVEEILYSALEDFYIDVVVGQGPTARSIKMPVVPFTLVGATTRMASLSSPLVSRFGIRERFEYYDVSSLTQIITRSAHIEGINLSASAAKELAIRSRGTPRIANRLLRRVRDFAEVKGESTVTADRVDVALSSMEIDCRGLEPLDRKIMSTLLSRYDGGPVGVETLAHTIGEDRSTIEEVYEPFLVHNGLIRRGPRGREITEQGRKHIEQESF